MSVNCGMIVETLEKIAPQELAESWDNIGLLLGRPQQIINRVLLALDITTAVVNEAIAVDADMIVSHHPFPFRALKSIRTDTVEGAMIALLLKKDIAVYAAHTNLDSAAGGVNDTLASAFQLTEVEPLQKALQPLVKIVTFVPAGHEDSVWAAMSRAGAGNIGHYSQCSFRVAGKGTFFPEEGSQPFIGSRHQLATVDEVRLETIAPAELSGNIIQAMFAAHPYEDVAYDLYPLKNERLIGGMGRVGNLAAPISFRHFCELVKQVLGVKKVRAVGDLGTQIQRVAVCGGSGMKIAQLARLSGAQVLLTGDIGYHDAQQADSAGLLLVDAGHYATEVPVLQFLKEYLRQQFADINDGLVVSVATQQADIWHFI